MCIYIYIHIYVYTCIYICVHAGREVRSVELGVVPREFREPGSVFNPVWSDMYMYIYRVELGVVRREVSRVGILTCFCEIVLTSPTVKWQKKQYGDMRRRRIRAKTAQKNYKILAGETPKKLLSRPPAPYFKRNSGMMVLGV